MRHRRHELVLLIEQGSRRLSRIAGGIAGAWRRRPSACRLRACASYQQALTTATELIAYCRTLGVPFGINVESVSIHSVEIEASARLAEALRAQLRS